MRINDALLGIVAGCLAMACVRPAAAECPTNQIVVGALQGCANQTSTAPVLAILDPQPCLNGSGSCSYDLIAGNIMASSTALSHEGFDSWVQTADDFVIAGPASATPIPISVFLTADLLSGGFAEARLSSGALEAITDPAGPGHQVLRLDLAKLPGEHFSVGMYANAQASRFFGTSTTGVLGFTAPPPGYVLQSCQGYSALPVPTRAASWGRIKRYYR